jgi:hypothetical protein
VRKTSSVIPRPPTMGTCAFGSRADPSANINTARTYNLQPGHISSSLPRARPSIRGAPGCTDFNFSGDGNKKQATCQVVVAVTFQGGAVVGKNVSFLERCWRALLRKLMGDKWVVVYLQELCKYATIDL